MEDQDDSSINTPLSGWAFVNNQGELVQTGSDSETSESSIEVVSVEGNEVVSFHQGRKEHTGCAEAEEREFPCLNEASRAEESNTGAPREEKILSAQTNVSEREIKSLSPSQAVADIVPCLETSLPKNVTETCIKLNQDEADQSLLVGEVEIGKGNDGEEQVRLTGLIDALVLNQPNETVARDSEADETVKPVNSNEVKSSSDTEILEDLQVACCKELLSVNNRTMVDDGTLEKTGVSICSHAENTISEQDKEEEETSSLAGDNRSEISSDSDFVCLDPNNMEDLGVINHEGELASVPLHGSRPSIDDNFQFMRAQDAEAPIVHLPAMFHHQVDDNDGFEGDIDRDDETESSTEDGVDDRIESEQSEAGSNIAMNDVGDLSAFADIGDIPLVVGDVRRNYIHRPNNRLSTLLNISLLLAAILTTGISLGIIMATDLEIEEWQNAYELQTLRVKQLELQLQEKKSLLDMQDAKVLQLKDLANKLKFKLVGTSHKKTEDQKVKKALDWLEAHAVVEGEDFIHASHLVEGAIQLCIHCEEDLSCDDTGNDNEYIIQMTACKEKVEEYIRKLRGSSGIKRHSVTVDSMNEEMKHLETGRETGEATANQVPVSQDEPNVKETDKDFSKKEEIKNVDKILDTLSDQGTIFEMNIDNQPFSSERNPLSFEKFQGQGVVEIDIRQLQQTLSREQERALHWQNLYLFERRQRERERENEEWEDERDREEWEREWKIEKEAMKRSEADLSEVECLKKIFASNLTTLTQHVANLNISVFDDFANLSILLSSIQDMKQSVVDSFNKVWDGAEDVLERFERGATENAGPFMDKTEKLRHYLLEVVLSIQQNSGPQLQKLLSNLQSSLEAMKKGFKAMKDEVSSEKVAFWLEHVWRVTDGIMDKLKTNVGTMIPEKEILLTYITNLLDSLEMKYSAETAGMQEDAETYDVQDSQEENKLFSKPDYAYGDDDEEEDDDDNDNNDDEDDEEEGENGETYDAQNEKGWSAGIHNILGKTKRSFAHLGKKVSRTFGEIKSIWHKKDMPLVRIAKRLTSKFVRASVKFTKMCTKLPASLFKGTKDSKARHQVFVDSKQVKKLRKEWQKQLLKNPCEAAGMLSMECNLDRKTLKKELKEVSKLFSHLLRIKTLQPPEALGMNKKDAALHYGLFKSFLERWGERSMLLKRDLEWANCQRDWWFQVLQALVKLNGNGDKLLHNTCNTLSSDESFFPGGSAEKIDKLKIKKAKQNMKLNQNDGGKGKNVLHHESESSQENCVNISEAETAKDDEFSSKLHNEHSKYKSKDQSKDKNPSSDNTIKAVNRNHLWRNVDEDMDQRHYDWLLKKAEHRENQRKQHSKADWLFDRSRHRRQRKRNNQEQSKTYEEALEEENWALRHSYYRQQQRRDKHRADWVFDRAADRKEQHSALFNCDYPRQGKTKQHPGKEFRCAYGKVSLP